MNIFGMLQNMNMMMMMLLTTTRTITTTRTVYRRQQVGIYVSAFQLPVPSCQRRRISLIIPSIPIQCTSTTKTITNQHRQQYQSLASLRQLTYFTTSSLLSFSSSSSTGPNPTAFNNNNNIVNPLLMNQFDVIVVGGGHAGCEAAAASARIGAKTCLVTQKINTIGELSCNPSIGGIGKGHLVREIDALDGLQGVVADMAGIHYRTLNQRKGPAVRGPRAQMDRDIYQNSMQNTLRSYPNLYLMEASVQDLLLDESSSSQAEDIISSTSKHTPKPKAKIRGVAVQVSSSANDGNGGGGVATTNTHEIYSHAVIITTGTFLRGVLMIGHDKYSGGRHLRDSDEVEPPSTALAKVFERYNFPLGRLKTGTPARIDGRTINYDECIVQPTDNPAQPFSHMLQFYNQQPPNIMAGNIINCYQTATNALTHEMVMKYQYTLPTYDGLDGAGNGPRYCPSIYKKVQRFPDRTSHNSFLEPEGLNTHLVYPNGMSGPYPLEIQQKILRTMKGLGGVEIIRPGYDVEYDFINPLYSIQHTMETTKINGLYLAGQICGTTGYEEAAAQGIIAGANAGKVAFAMEHKLPKPNPFIIGRDEGYIGVLIDDLVTRGTTEPYRMFTSRSEYRITLRADNADLRLTQKGANYGLIQPNNERLEALQTRNYFLLNGIEQLQNFQLPITEWSKRGNSETMGGDQIHRRPGQKKSAEEVLMMPHVTLQQIEDVILQYQEEKELQHQDNDNHQEKSIEDIAKNPGDACVDDSLIVDVEKSTKSSRHYYSSAPAFIFDTLEATVKYQSYVRRQNKDMESWRKAQGLRIPADIIYTREYLPTFSSEELEKLQRIRPSTFADASQISGLTPNSLVYLYHHVNKRFQKRDQNRGKVLVSAASLSSEPEQQ